MSEEATRRERWGCELPCGWVELASSSMLDEHAMRATRVT